MASLLVGCLGSSGKFYEAGREAITRDDIATAIADFDAALKANPRDIDSLRWRAWCRVVRRELDLALADLDRAIEIDPQNTWVHYERAVMLEEMGKYTDAVDGFTQAIERDPTHFKSFQHRGWTYRLMGNHEGAVADLSRAIELTPAGDPDMPRLLHARSQSLFQLGRVAEAQRDEERLEAYR